MAGVGLEPPIQENYSRNKVEKAGESTEKTLSHREHREKEMQKSKIRSGIAEFSKNLSDLCALCGCAPNMETAASPILMKFR